MASADTLDIRAQQAATRYMGDFAWPTVVMGLLDAVAYIAVVYLVLAGMLGLGWGVLLIALLTYVMYTVVHDAAHGSISGSRQDLRWVNEAMGYLGAFIFMIPLTAHRHEHLAHHRNTNNADTDPDFAVANLWRNPAYPLVAMFRIWVGQFRYYIEHRWGKGPRKQDVIFCIELVVGLAPRLWLLAAGFWFESFALFVVGGMGGLLVTMYLFAYLVHHPHTAQGRWVDTSTFILPGKLGTVFTWFYLFQNYHSIHHLYPRVPFYHYRRLFEDIEPVMQQKGSPIYRFQKTLAS